MWSALTALAIGVAILGLGAPFWILVPTAWLGATLYALAANYAHRHSGGGHV
jgi:hypothetical protein